MISEKKNKIDKNYHDQYKDFFKIVPKGYTYDDLLLVPGHSKLKSRSEVDISSELFSNIKLKIPIISANMSTISESQMVNEMCRIGATGAIHRYLTPQKIFEEWSKCQDSYISGVSIGVIKSDYKTILGMILDSLDTLPRTIRPYFIIDVAHGDHENVIETLKFIKKENSSLKIIVGNIVTPTSAMRLIDYGADALKVGIGPGNQCSTRVVTGCGFPQLSAIKNIKNSIDTYNYKHVKIIADGGIKNSGDIVKAYAAGADTVMIGRIIAGTKETPGNIYFMGKKEKKFKLYSGMSSKKAQIDYKNVEENILSEGISSLIPYQGNVENIILKLEKAIKHGFSYLGCKNISQVHEYGKDPYNWIRVTNSGNKEGFPKEY